MKSRWILYSLFGLMLLLSWFAIFVLFYTPIEDAVRIESKSDRYLNWLEDERPYLRSLSANSSLDRRVELFGDGPHLYPYVFYEVIYGDNDGVASLSYKLSVDDSFNAKKVIEENHSIIILPAMEKSSNSERIRNVYHGRYIDSYEVPGVLKRILDGDRLLDIKKSVLENPDYPLSTFADTDPWKDLKSNKTIEEQPIQPPRD